MGAAVIREGWRVFCGVRKAGVRRRLKGRVGVGEGLLRAAGRAGFARDRPRAGWSGVWRRSSARRLLAPGFPRRTDGASRNARFAGDPGHRAALPVGHGDQPILCRRNAALHGFGALARGLEADQRGIGCGRVRSFADKEVRAADTPRRHRAVGPACRDLGLPRRGGRGLGRGVCRSPRAPCCQYGNAPRRRPDRQGTGRWPPVMPPAGLGAGVASVFGQAVRGRLGLRAGRWQSSERHAPVAMRRGGRAIG